MELRQTKDGDWEYYEFNTNESGTVRCNDCEWKGDWDELSEKKVGE